MSPRRRLDSAPFAAADSLAGDVTAPAALRMVAGLAVMALDDERAALPAVAWGLVALGMFAREQGGRDAA